MNKLTAEKCREQFEQWFRDVEAGDDDNWSSPPYLSREWHEYLSRRQLALGAWNAALEIALPILEQQERGEGEWVEWGGGAMPVSEIEFVEYRMRDGFSDSCFADDIRWNHKGGGFDIIAYRIIPERATNQNGDAS